MIDLMGMTVSRECHDWAGRDKEISFNLFIKGGEPIASRARRGKSAVEKANETILSMSLFDDLKIKSV